MTKRSETETDAPSDLSGVERLLLTVDAGLLARIEHEVAILSKAARERASRARSTSGFEGYTGYAGLMKLRKLRIAGHAVTRSQVIRDLIRESLDVRARGRGEPVLSVEPAEPFEHAEDAPTTSEAPTITEAIALLDADPDAPASADDFDEHNPLSFDPVPADPVPADSVQVSTTSAGADNGLIQPSGLSTESASGSAGASAPGAARAQGAQGAQGAESDEGGRSGPGSGSGRAVSSASRPTIHLKPFGLRRK